MTITAAAVRRVGFEELCAQNAPSAWPKIDGGQQVPNASWVIVENRQLAARCSAWWTTAHSIAGERIAIVGHFAAGSREAANSVLEAACDTLREVGATIAIGPMDGDTWHRYRFVTSGDSEPPFFLEPENPPEWPQWFAEAGWSVHTRYHSSVNEDLSRIDPSTEAKAAKLSSRGVTIRDMDLGRADDELRGLHAVAERCFRDSYLYTPLDAAGFAALYRPTLPYVDARLVSIAEHRGNVVGFCFCVPNVIERAEGRRTFSAVLKTFAVLPGYEGLGGLLAARTNAAARRLGYTRIIHALMHERNERSRALSARSAREIRQYALFARRLR